MTELDGLRGALLLLMTVNHMPSPLRAWTSQPLGFTSAAEGFVFLSAFLAGLVYYRRSAKVGAESAGKALLQRAGVVLAAHYLTFGIIFALLGLWLAPQIPAFHNMVWPMVKMPLQSLGMGALLVYEPPILDILPLYVMLLAITPLVLGLAQRVGWRWVLGGSALLWAFSQRPPLKLKLLDWSNLGHPWDFGNFDQFAWQFLWVLGLALGAWVFRKPAEQPLLAFTGPARAWRLPLLASGGALMTYFFLARHGFLYFNLNEWWWLLDKWRLGPMRMLSFALHLGFFMVLARALRPIGQLSFLTYLGKRSLPVFSSHAIIALLATGFSEHYHYSDTLCYLLVGSAVAALYGTAWISSTPYWRISWWREQRRGEAVSA